MKKFLKTHKFISGAVVVMVFALGYWWYASSTSTGGETRYVMATAQKTTIVSSVTGSGQVSASNSIDIKARVSGDLVAVPAVNGQTVNAGALIARLDDSDAQKNVRNAETDLETAKLELDKLLAPPDALTLLQAENSIIQARESKQKAEDDLATAYETGFNAVANAFLDLPAVVTGLNDIFFTSTIDKGQLNIEWYANQASEDLRIYDYKNNVTALYQAARTQYNKNLDSYKAAGRSSNPAVIEALILETYETTKAIADAVKAGHDYVSFVIDIKVQHNAPILSNVSAHNTTLNGYIGTVNGTLSDLLSSRRSIQSAKDAITAAERSIEEKELSLKKTKEGPDDLDIRAKKIAIRQREDTLLTVRQALADHSVYAPFGGVIAKVSVKKGDSLNSGAAVATLISEQKIAEASLNEVDVAKIRVGQKATLTFAAVDGLNIAGQVADVDTIGTVSQGVVTYAVKIGFGTEDDRVKPGMSVSAAIITDVKQDVLAVQNSAVKSQGTGYSVEVFDQKMPESQGNQGVTSATLPRSQTVEIGVSNDTLTEITSGLKEGDQLITRTIAPSTTATTQAPSLFGGGGARIGR
ncbi:hypothetical protein A3C91_02620 [Candidatus Azambacteria bacterium RIFCSPHIGHO2_02_FULL_52_12]|uniref:Uncharacterized protein n=1 Tax=Candidatus Azambacteria bacterium RIFCSPLOWO2_01_FULL_46_25 TaxID=1797298 RepID=A0A1F5BTJ8_9BACT|nr:MAG: hypothetical protein A3C91_02620 [Candidatus Azambacteria bacterium RIFCSPHIGHO2_02_FULL_52_12]OGD33929.1 MAG: hypothetical protein A2988_00345 [Candidatus Azambacteria bacterium RIFCSPLOWO2_01_FULL_46_25]OGD37730.1 MAG: hypothetical protein A2850_04345 [Candidatus Azambacteria bacterium RIFCSPHIGHO2_01_FULL_51_74]